MSQAEVRELDVVHRRQRDDVETAIGEAGGEMRNGHARAAKHERKSSYKFGEIFLSHGIPFLI